jgi:alkanesulfonate monooxygenase SsuD/methylene tetrahydromethanopterin reductase-like flavin-dependent oxidoreductase (luciferase family)
MTPAIEVGTTPWSWRGLGPADSLCVQAEVAESMGFHSFWLPENHFGERGVIPSPLTLLAAVAARTTRIRLGTTSYLLPIRPPLLAAEEVAVLDRLSGGRVILGLGRGIGKAMFTAFGVDPADKRRLFKANLDIMLRAWRGEPVATGEEGEPIHLAPLPLQQPSPPIWVAAFGPLALKQVAGLGLPYLASPIESLATLEENYRLYHIAVAEAGLPAVQTIPVMRSVFITRDKATVVRVRDGLQEMLPAVRRDEVADLEGRIIVGEGQYVRDKLIEYRERLGLSQLILRGGIPGVEEAEQLRSHAALLEIVGGL